MSVTIHETKPRSPNYTKISPNFASQAPQGARPSLWALHVMLFLPEDPPPNSPKHRLPRGSCRPHRPPASPPFPPQPHHSASRFLLRFCIATQGPEQPAYSSLPHLSPAAPWELAISWISGRPVLGTMSGGQEDPEGSGDFDWSKLALSFILMRFFGRIR